MQCIQLGLQLSRPHKKENKMGFRRRSTGETTPAVEPKKTATKGKSNYNKMGAILEKKDGGVYLKLDETFDIAGLTYNGKPVKSLQIEDPTAKFDRMVASGKMTEADADEKAAKVPSYVLFEVQVVVE